MHILILGAAGMVGRKLTARLVAEGQLGGAAITDVPRRHYGGFLNK